MALHAAHAWLSSLHLARLKRIFLLPSRWRWLHSTVAISNRSRSRLSFLRAVRSRPSLLLTRQHTMTRPSPRRRRSNSASDPPLNTVSRLQHDQRPRCHPLTMTLKPSPPGERTKISHRSTTSAQWTTTMTRAGRACLSGSNPKWCFDGLVATLSHPLQLRPYLPLTRVGSVQSM